MYHFEDRVYLVLQDIMQQMKELNKNLKQIAVSLDRPPQPTHICYDPNQPEESNDPQADNTPRR